MSLPECYCSCLEMMGLGQAHVGSAVDGVHCGMNATGVDSANRCRSGWPVSDGIT